jgi:hypothetical protein
MAFYNVLSKIRLAIVLKPWYQYFKAQPKRATFLCSVIYLAIIYLTPTDSASLEIKLNHTFTLLTTFLIKVSSRNSAKGSRLECHYCIR